MIRGLIALLATFLIAFQLTVIVLGYQEYGTYPPVGTLQAVDPYLTRIVDVSPDGAAAGATARDVIDTRFMTVDQRIADYTHAWKGGTTFNVRVYHADGTATLHRKVSFTGWTWQLVLDLAIRVSVFVLALFLIARGEGAAGVWAGVALVGFGLAEGHAFNWGAVPLEAGVGAFIVQASGFLLAYAGSYFFADAFVRSENRKMPVFLAIIYWTFVALLTIMLAVERSGIFTGYAALNAARFVSLSQLFTTLGLIAVFGYVSTGSSTASSVRVLFWSYLIGAIGLECNQIAGFLGYDPPLDGSLYLMYLVFAVGLTYSVVAKRLTRATLIIGRVAIYALILAAIVAIFALIERAIAMSALPAPVAFAVELAVPLVLGLLMPRIAHRIERIAEILLHHEKLDVRNSMKALIDDVPHMVSGSVLETAAVEDIKRYLQPQFTILYREAGAQYDAVASQGIARDELTPIRSDDRAFLRMRTTRRAIAVDEVDSAVRGAIAVPLDVGGQITGALILGPREGDRPYDPDEIAMVEEFARVLGVTLLRVERNALRLPAHAAPA